uniref:F-box domain-containing protein n=1 Tax=Quercus lobata TaxID=97700 RepID=A0A7N2R134_QUELO
MWSRDLPENLVVEILSRSPVKSLMRFKSVRKSWHAHLRNHSFITQHHKWATSDNQGRGVVFTHEHHGQTHVALLSNDTLEMSRDIELVILPRECLYGEEILLWNPATRESKLLPIIKQRSRYSGPYVAYNFGFGIDPKTNDLKVVRIVDFYRHKQPQFEVYNLSTDSWRVIDTPVGRLDYIFYPRFPSYLMDFITGRLEGMALLDVGIFTTSCFRLT